MHQALLAAERQLDIELPNLRIAADLTREKIAAAERGARSYLRDVGLEGQHNLDVVVFGSIARDEMTDGSDFDWLVVARRYSENPQDFVHFKRAALQALAESTAKEPGASGLFGTAVGAAELVNTIGLDRDTNLTQTRRVLILEESCSLLEPDRHRELRHAITARYLHDQRRRADGLPRFLLNDVVRYWRTVAVDYQAKRWREVSGGRKWGLRLLKLRSSRKLTYAGTVASLFWSVLNDREPTTQELVEQWEMPPLARLAQLTPVLGPDGRAALSHTLLLADRFSGWLADHEVRSEAEQVEHPREAADGSPLHDAYLATHDLQEALISLFFCGEEVEGSAVQGGLRALSHRYLVF